MSGEDIGADFVTIQAMKLTFLRARLHRACVTHVEPDYDGSCAIDGELLNAAGISEYEQIDLYNITNGERLTTYAISAQPGSRIISVNGAAAHKADPGDRLIIAAYANLEPEEVMNFKPTLVYLDADNHIEQIRNEIPAQVA